MLGFAAIPAAGNFAGGLMAEFTEPSPRRLSIALHLAVGIVLGVVAVEALPRALETERPYMMAAAFAVGGIAYVVLDRAIDSARRRWGSGGEGQGPWMIYSAVAVDLLADGILIGSGSAIGTSLGLVLALGQVIADAPEGFATIGALRKTELSRTKRLALAAAFLAPALLGAAVGFTALREQPEWMRVAAFVAAAGLLMTATVEDMVREAHEAEHRVFDSVALVLGFCGFMLLSTVLGS